MNVDDSDRVGRRLASLGYRPTDDPIGADLIIVNTCSVREKAAQKVYSLLGRLAEAKRAKPTALLAVAGCLAQQEGREMLDRVDYLDLVVGAGAMNRLPDLLVRAARGERIVDTDLDRELPLAWIDRPEPVPLRSQATIMQGCDNFCTYCVVPYLRGRERCRRPEEIIAEVEAKVSAGAREMNLLGQNVNSYRYDDWDLAALIEALVEIDGLERIKFTTSHPKDLTDRLIDCFARFPKLSSFLHLPFQAGSDAVLKRMNRGYTKADYLALTAKVRRARPDVALSADCIVGFPGETDDDFRETMDLIEQVRFDSLFSFRYSDRPLAPARKFKNKVDHQTATDRIMRLQERQREISLEANRALEGRVMKILVEGPAKRGEMISGRTDSNKVVNFAGPRSLIGRTAPVLIVKAWTNSLQGRLADDKIK